MSQITMYPPGGGPPGKFLSQSVAEMKRKGWTTEKPKAAPPPIEPAGKKPAK